MGISRKEVSGWLAAYNPEEITIGVVASHSSLQILHGARQEGFRTLGIAVGDNRRRLYSAFPGAEPDEWLMLDDYRELLSQAEWLRQRNVIIIPHGSLVEYLGAENFRNLEVPTFGNRNILKWESSRESQRKWLESGGCTMPAVITDPHDIDGPVIVKYAGAKGGRGYFIARDYRDFRRNANIEEDFTIQEYVLGCRYYMHFYFDPTATDGYQVRGTGKNTGKYLGRLELLSMDRRDESNVDEFYKLGSLRDLREMAFEPSFVVTGNQPVVIRESLLPRAFELAEGTVSASFELEDDARGMIGPFCLETIVTDKLEFKVFEISARIVAGSNPFVGGSPYSDINEYRMSTGRRIARSIRNSLEKGELSGLIS
ncbi:MAG: formate--phosphoribosylaminoimidazolecarboxamide ligase [Candidatus Poseidoniaceae archaeon]|jgi:5-formaminoimidazole-4-carboxamide-1-(beta)-D-ribofuranosyl 5'-monophosphate synthetase|nr:formate--phosphoribosylaminoimidazolecarboxamide ligase [Candidatus Poseidoniaceae archaeon]MDP7001503.1 formate--phosphoribosylaminoimidazolecarboxamide ligase [Candidatus Poseidoniaceae archaeon]